MNHLVFLSYGSGPNVGETQFAILSALYRAQAAPANYQIVLVTDAAAAYSDLGIAIEPVSAQQFRAWTGPANYNHRIKIMALQHVLNKFGGRAVLLDSDTYFLRSPGRLFERVSPGRSIMHLCEGEIGHLVALGFNRHRLAQIKIDLDRAGRFDFSPASSMWNSGVVGIDLADAPLLNDVTALCDAIHAQAPTNVSEQVAFGCVLARHTRLAAARDVVFHYHQSFMRDPFRARLPQLLRQTAALPPLQRARALYAHRPVAPYGKKIKAALKRPFKPLGFFRHDLETSI